VKLSVFSVGDGTYSYGVVEFEEGESVLEEVAKSSPTALKEELGRKLGSPLTSLSLASGAMDYRGELLPMVYIRAELEDGSDFSLEIYPTSARSLSNTGAEEHFNTLVKLLDALKPGLKLPKARVIGIA